MLTIHLAISLYRFIYVIRGTNHSIPTNKLPWRNQKNPKYIMLHKKCYKQLSCILRTICRTVLTALFLHLKFKGHTCSFRHLIYIINTMGLCKIKPSSQSMLLKLLKSIQCMYFMIWSWFWIVCVLKVHINHLFDLLIHFI